MNNNNTSTKPIETPAAKPLNLLNLQPIFDC